MRESLRAQIDHVDAAIIGIQHGHEINRARKRPDGMDGIREMKLRGWQAVRETLAWLQDHESDIRSYVETRRGRGEVA